MTDFFQDAPQLQNTFTNDQLLQAYLKKLPADVLKNIQPHLQYVGEMAATQWLEWAKEAENNEPKYVPFDPWGRRIDDIIMCSGWKNLEKAAATEGVVAAAYERKFAEWSRVYQMTLLYLFHSSSSFVSCPLAMTDGGARALELYGNDSQKSRGFRHLTTRDPKEFWTSGQWMTERTGGSDVSGTSTVAKKYGNQWALNGVKWFTSATTSQMTMLLARPEGAEAGSRGLSLFYVETRKPDGRLNNIEILRLKDKLGTRAMPTAELQLKDTPAELVGDMGGGVKKIASILNITRIYNSICAISAMRRALDWAQSYSRVRVAFGKKIIDHPLHKALLDNLERTFQDCFKMTFFVVELLGKEETNTATENEKILLRALTPIVKLYTGKKVIEITSEVAEIFGGAGYIEDTGIPTLVRDAQVFSIWEGTTNVLSLDFLRALEKEQAWPILAEYWKSKKTEVPPRVLEILSWAQKGEREKVETHARELSYLIAQTVTKSLQM
jgi:putative acyl-CoA dehydrogenase